MKSNQMKSNRLFVLSVIVVVSACVGCTPVGGRPETAQNENGTYRGVFISGDRVEVNIEFTLNDGVVTAARFRHLKHGEYALDTQEEPFRSVVDQHREVLDYLIGKKLGAHLIDLYHPEKLVITQVDGYSGATLRSAKIISAIRDGLNRGVYSY